MVKSWIQEATPDVRKVPVCLDRRLVSELTEAQERLAELEGESEGMLEKPAEVLELRERVAALEVEVKEKSHELSFEGLGWGGWRDLLAKHPPAEDQAETFNRAVELGFMPHSVENIGFNAQTFVPAAIAASCADLTEADVVKLLEVAPAGVIERIWSAVLEANLAGAADPFV